MATFNPKKTYSFTPKLDLTPVKKSSTDGPLPGLQKADVAGIGGALLGNLGGGGKRIGSGGGKRIGSGGGSSSEIGLNPLRGEIRSRGESNISLANAMLALIDEIVREKTGAVDEEYQSQASTLSKTLADALPAIKQASAARGAGDSTDVTMKSSNARDTFNTGVESLKKSREKDLTDIGDFATTNKAKQSTRIDSINRILGRLDADADKSNLLDTRSDMDALGDTLAEEQRSAGTDSGLRSQLSGITGTAKTGEDANSALDSIINSSLSQSSKLAAIDTVGDSLGLSDADKRKRKSQVNAMFGNAYSS